MNWTQIIESVGVATGAVAAIAWLARASINNFFSRELEESKIEIKAEHDRKLALELSELRAQHEKALGSLKAEADERLELLKAAMGRLQALAEDLAKNRGEGYREIWTLTDSLNLFGTPTKVDGEDLSNKLKHWYFEDGWVLTEASKKRYFLVQEILSFGMLHSVSYARPADEKIYGSDSRPIDVLRRIRGTQLHSEILGDEDEHPLDKMESYVNAWKSAVPQNIDTEEANERNWIMLQFMLSAFRSGIVKELGSRTAIH